MDAICLAWFTHVLNLKGNDNIEVVVTTKENANHCKEATFLFAETC